jgi:hypothetical protein
VISYQSAYDSLNRNDEPWYAISGGLRLGGVVPNVEAAVFGPFIAEGYTVIVPDTVDFGRTCTRWRRRWFSATMGRPSPGWLLSGRRKRWSQIFEHGEVSHVEGGQLQPLDIRGCCDEVIAESNTGVAAAVSAHHFTGMTGDDFGGRFCAKG